MNALFIDTSDRRKVGIGLFMNRKRYAMTQKLGVQKAQRALPMIDAILKKHALSIKEIKRVRVNTGPGSFTGLRVGIAIANALSYSLRIPVNGKAIVEPHYE